MKAIPNKKERYDNMKIQFLGGESKVKHGVAVNYMISECGKLYAEHVVKTDDEMEGYNYLYLEISKQSKEIGINYLEFI